MKTSEEKQNKVIELHNKDLTYDLIHKELGICKNTIIKILKEHGIIEEKYSSVEITDELIEQIQKRYDEIGNIKKVAKEFHISYERLSKIKTFKRNAIKKENLTDNPHYQKQYARKVKEQLVEYKGGKCEICGYNKCIEALDFHHINPEEKDFNISGGTKSFEKMKPEVDKCILVCSNCHREIHAGIIDL